MVDRTAALAVVQLADARIAALSAIAGVSGRLPQFEAGEQVQARVVAKLADGNFKIDIGGAALRAALPEGVEPGDTLSLRFVTNEPRPTYVLARQAQSSAATGATLSDVAKLIDHVVSHDAKVAPPQISSARPLVEAHEPTPRHLAIALREAVETSGLFYESHLTEWVAGQHPLERLQLEPQAQWQALQQEQSAPAARPQTAMSPNHAEPNAALNSPSAETPLAALAQPVLRSQLDALETNQFVWHGEAWPGQSVQWHVDASDADAHGEQRLVPQQVASTLRVVLPQLGEVSAEINWRAGAIHLAIRAGQSATQTTLQAQLGNLQHAFDAAGLNLAGAEVARL